MLSPPRKVVLGHLARLCAETGAHEPASAVNALALEDALSLVWREKGVVEFLRTLIVTREELTRRGPQGIVLCGPRNSGKRRLIDEGIERADSDTLKRCEFSEFMHDARERLIMFRRDRSLRLRDPVPHLVAQMTKPKLLGGDGVRLLVLENMDIYCLPHAWVMRRLFLGLLGHGVGLIISSQRPPSQWYQGGVNAHKLVPFVDLVRSRCLLLRIDGEEIEQKRLQN